MSMTRADIEARLKAANDAYQAYDMGDMDVEDSDGWEFDSSGIEFVRAFYVRHEDNDVPHSQKLTFVVTFDGEGNLLEAYARNDAGNPIGKRLVHGQGAPYGDIVLDDTPLEVERLINTIHDAMRDGYTIGKLRTVLSDLVSTPAAPTAWFKQAELEKLASARGARIGLYASEKPDDACTVPLYRSLVVHVADGPKTRRLIMTAKALEQVLPTTRHYAHAEAVQSFRAALKDMEPGNA